MVELEFLSQLEKFILFLDQTKKMITDASTMFFVGLGLAFILFMVVQFLFYQLVSKGLGFLWTGLKRLLGLSMTLVSILLPSFICFLIYRAIECYLVYYFYNGSEQVPLYFAGSLREGERIKEVIEETNLFENGYEFIKGSYVIGKKVIETLFFLW